MTASTVLQPADLLQILAEVVSSLVDEAASDALRLSPDGRATDEPPTPRADSVSAAVSVTGAWDGHVVVQCGADLARDLASGLLMLPADDVGGEDVADAMGEMANVIGGNVKSLLPAPSTLSLPHVITGIDVAQHWPAAIESCRLDLLWGDKPLSVSVWESADAKGRQP